MYAYFRVPKSEDRKHTLGFKTWKSSIAVMLGYQCPVDTWSSSQYQFITSQTEPFKRNTQSALEFITGGLPKSALIVLLNS